MEIDTIQHTPKPAAQVPVEDPPLDVHSEFARQVPDGEAASPVEHSKFGNWTIENRENISESFNVRIA